MSHIDIPSPAPRRRTRSLLLLSASFALLVAFTVLAVGVKHQTLFVKADALCRDVLHEHASASPEVAAVFAAVSELASRRALWAEVAAMILALLALRRWRTAIVCALACAGTGMGPMLKMWIDRARPLFVNPLVAEKTTSFPSSHAVGSTIVCGMLTYLCIKAVPRRWLTFVTLFGSLVALIGFSRVYLGAHWLSDVLAGECFGLGWVLAWIALAEAWVKPPARPERGKIPLPSGRTAVR